MGTYLILCILVRIVPVILTCGTVKWVYRMEGLNLFLDFVMVMIDIRDFGRDGSHSKLKDEAVQNKPYKDQRAVLG